MKSLIATLTLWCALSASGCKLLDNADHLTDPTMTGKNTFSCLVNGKVWVANDVFPYSPIKGILAYDTLFVADVYNYRDNSLMYLEVRDSHFATGVFALTKVKCRLQNQPDYTDVETGQVVITKRDSIDRVCAGTFAFIAKNVNGDKIIVTEGRFDLITY